MIAISLSQSATGDAAASTCPEVWVLEDDDSSTQLSNETETGDDSWNFYIEESTYDDSSDELPLGFIPVMSEPLQGVDAIGLFPDSNLTAEPAVTEHEETSSDTGDALLDVEELITVEGRIVYENVITSDQLGQDLPRTNHNYDPNTNANWVLYGSPSATQVEVFFPKIEVQRTYDHLYVRDGNNSIVFQTVSQLYTDTWVTVPGNVVKIQFTSDSSTQYWGFEVTKFVPSQYRYIGVAGATVEIWDDDFLGDQLLCEVTTDISGCFIKENLSNHDEWGSYGQDIIVRARTTSDNARVIEEYGGDYTFITSMWQDVPDGTTLDIGTWRSADASNSAWIVYSTLMDGWFTLKNGGPSDTVPFVKAVWTLGHSSDYGYGGCTSTTHYHFDDAAAGQIHLTSNDGQVPDTVLHEYGHHLMWYAYDEWIPADYGYSHMIKDNLKESEAWQEGWPELIHAVVGHWTGKGDTYRDCGAGYNYGHYYDMEGSQQLKLGVVETFPGSDDWLGGDTNEATISYSLYDVYDSACDGADAYNGGFTKIWTVMKSGRHYGLPDWFDGWRKCYLSSTGDITGCGNSIKQGSRGTINYDPVVFFDDFSDGNIGDWVTSGGDNVTVDTGIGNVSAPCMKIYKGAVGASESSSKHRFPVQGGDFVVEAKIRTPNPTGCLYMFVMTGTDYGVYVGIESGQIRYFDTYWHSTGVTCVANAWYLVTLDIRAASGYFDIYIDGLLKTSNAKFFGGVTGQKFLDGVKFQAGYWGQTYKTLYVDDVVVRGGKALFQDQFRDNLDDWTKDTSGGPVSWDQTKGMCSVPSISLYKQTISYGTSAKHYFSSKSDGRVFLEARAMVSTTLSSKWCYVNLYSGSSIESYLVLRDGYIKYYSGTTWYTTTFNYAANSWFKIGIDVDLESGKYDLYANGVKLVSYIPMFAGTGSVSYVYLQAGCYNAFSGVTLWVDDIAVTYR